MMPSNKKSYTMSREVTIKHNFIKSMECRKITKRKIIRVFFFFQKATKISNKQPNPPPTRIREKKTNKTQGNSKDHKVAIMSDSLQPHRLYSPWNSPGQNTAVGRLSLLQGIFPTQGLNPRLPHCIWILYQLSHKGSKIRKK